jgi:hypothetical protein
MIAPGQQRGEDAVSVIDRQNLRAGDGEAAGAEFLRSTAERRSLDLSRYSVSIRWPGGAECRRETVGRPVLLALPSVNVLVTTTNLQVFGPAGEPRWQASLAYPVDDEWLAQFYLGHGPCQEIANRLYVADLANLTVLDLGSGQVLWRLPAIGIKDFQTGPDGGLYVAASTAGPESIQYRDPKDADVSVKPLLMKVDSGGAVRWQVAGRGSGLRTSGEFLYTTHAQVSKLDLMHAADDEPVPVHTRIFRMDPKDGRMLWEYYRRKAPETWEARANRILLQFPDELQMVGYFSF